MDLLIQIYVFILGLVFGSFYNVCILRPFSNETLTKPKTSKCPVCGHKLAWYDNIPLFSYIILLAKCRYCKTPISWQYPLVELTTALLFLGTYLKFGLSWTCLFMLIAISYFIIMSGTDFKGQVIFNKHYIPFIIISVIYGGIVSFVSGNYYDNLLGLVAGVVILEIYARSGYLVGLKNRVCGEGDSYIIAGIGAILGLKFILIAIVLAVLTQTLWSIPMLIVKYIKNQKYFEVIAMVMFIIVMASYIVIDYSNGFDQFWLYITYLVIIFVLAIKICIDLIQSAKLDSQGGLSLPFGPALFLGALVMIFFNEQIIELLKQVEWLQNIL